MKQTDKAMAWCRECLDKEKMKLIIKSEEIDKKYKKHLSKEKFYHEINFGRYPKYLLSQIKEGAPQKDCLALACTETGNTIIVKYEGGKWQQAHFTSTDSYEKQEIYYDDVTEKIIYWIDGKPEVFV